MVVRHGISFFSVPFSFDACTVLELRKGIRKKESFHEKGKGALASTLVSLDGNFRACVTLCAHVSKFKMTTASLNTHWAGTIVPFLLLDWRECLRS
jgi:hypothetical protein